MRRLRTLRTAGRRTDQPIVRRRRGDVERGSARELNAMGEVVNSTIAERVARIEREISGVAAQYGVTDWERQFLRSVAARRTLSPKQAEVLSDIERKVFDGDDEAA